MSKGRYMDILIQTFTMIISNIPVESHLHKQLVDYCYKIIGCMHYVHENLGPGLPEYTYQEALNKRLIKSGFTETKKEYIHYPLFDGEPLESYVRMDLMVPMDRGNVIIECKSIVSITDKERYQTYGYLRATQFPIAILVNFSAWPKAQIERYYYDRKKQTIHAF